MNVQHVSCFRPQFLKVWFLGPQHHSRACQKCAFLASTSELQNQNVKGCGPTTFLLMRTEGDFYELWSLRITILDISPNAICLPIRSCSLFFFLCQNWSLERVTFQSQVGLGSQRQVCNILHTLPQRYCSVCWLKTKCKCVTEEQSSVCDFYYMAMCKIFGTLVPVSSCVK